MTSTNGDLVANAISTLTFDTPGSVTVENLAPEGTADSIIYGSSDGVTVPAPDGSVDNTFAISPGESVVVNYDGVIWYPGLLDIDNAAIPMPGLSLQLVSAGTPSYSVGD